MDLIRDATRYDDFGLRKEFPWPLYRSTEPGTVRVHCNSEKTYVKNLLNINNDVKCIRRVENPYLWARYVLRSEELNAVAKDHEVSERIVIHATSLQNAENIAKENFDWRKVNRSRFGKGVSFATSAQYARQHATRSESYIIAGILVGKTSEGYWDVTIPDNDCDTTNDRYGNVLVKYNDDDFYPYYIVETE